MTTKSPRSCPFAVALLGGLLWSLSAHAAENKHDVEILKQMREVCMANVGVPPFCACAENAVKQHIPSGALYLNSGGALEISSGTDDEVYDAVNAAVSECGDKFAPDQWKEEVHHG